MQKMFLLRMVFFLDSIFGFGEDFGEDFSSSVELCFDGSEREFDDLANFFVGEFFEIA